MNSNIVSKQLKMKWNSYQMNDIDTIFSRATLYYIGVS